jgi:hypothetical protein
MRREALHQSIHDGENEYRGDHETNTAQVAVRVFARIHGFVIQPIIVAHRDDP